MRTQPNSHATPPRLTTLVTVGVSATVLLTVLALLILVDHFALNYAEREAGQRLQQLSWQMRDALNRGGVKNAEAGDIVWSADRHRLSSAPGSVSFLNTDKNVPRLSYFITDASAAINAQTFATTGYTIEAFIKINPAWVNSKHAWMNIMTRDGVRGEGIRGGYGAVYPELRALETLGVCRRGYFVEGLGGAQFAVPGAVERLRELRAPGSREHEREALVLAAADPAQPYGAAIPWPRRAGARAARVAGAWVILLGGEAVLFVERGGRSLVPLREPDPDWLRPAFDALVAHVRAGGAKRLAVERFDGAPVVESDALELLVEAGFLAGPRRAVLRP